MEYEYVEEGKVTEPLSVSEYITSLNAYLNEQEARIVGEVSQCKIHAPSGHVYFTIKDRKADGILECVLFKKAYALCGIKLAIGMEIIVSGHPAIYAARGQFEIIAETVELVGEGELKKQYDALKKKLEAEGIFDPARKRTVPEFAQNIGIITSTSGAVIHDFIGNLGKFGFKAKILDSRVEGQTAVKDLLRSIRQMKKENIEALVIIRGGGSLESLQAFNNERLVREIVDFPVPVIAGIGHDKDVPLITLAADCMASTPTATANVLNKSWERGIYEVRQLEKEIISSYENRLRDLVAIIDTTSQMIQIFVSRLLGQFKEQKIKLFTNFRLIGRSIKDFRGELSSKFLTLTRSFQVNLSSVAQKIESIQKNVGNNNPERQLRLGYAITRIDQKVVKSVHAVQIHQNIDVQLADGTIISEVKKIK